MFISNEYGSIEKFDHFIIDTTNIFYKIDSEIFNDSIETANELIHNTHSKNNLPSKCIVVTDAYLQIINQESFVFSGRKGSAKTTLVEIIEKYDHENFESQYKRLYPLIFEKMNVEIFFETFRELKLLLKAKTEGIDN